MSRQLGHSYYFQRGFTWTELIMKVISNDRLCGLAPRGQPRLKLCLFTFQVFSKFSEFAWSRDSYVLTSQEHLTFLVLTMSKSHFHQFLCYKIDLHVKNDDLPISKSRK
jgi:hypothetical protein